MTETAQKEVPKFRVMQAPGFATGLQVHPVDSEIDWVVPEDWNEKRYGKHFASHGPSMSFLPLNKAAEDLMEDHKAKVAEMRKPKPTAGDERFAKLESMHLEMMQVVLALQAENRRLREDAEEKEEKGKKK